MPGLRHCAVGRRLVDVVEPDEFVVDVIVIEVEKFQRFVVVPAVGFNFRSRRAVYDFLGIQELLVEFRNFSDVVVRSARTACRVCGRGERNLIQEPIQFRLRAVGQGLFCGRRREGAGRRALRVVLFKVKPVEVIQIR